MGFQPWNGNKKERLWLKKFNGITISTLRSAKHAKNTRKFRVQWTPTLVLLDGEGEEHHRTVGFLAPEELLPALRLGIGKSHFDHEQYTEAEKILQQLLTEHPKSDSSAEAAYYLGVSRYKRTRNADELKKTIHHLQQDFPQSEWAKRASS
jgi:thioredoxin-related protein